MSFMKPLIKCKVLYAICLLNASFKKIQKNVLLIVLCHYYTVKNKVYDVGVKINVTCLYIVLLQY